MKIGIIGTRGIPNAYGGFEQFAEYLSLFLEKKGHDIYVYNSSLHPYQKDNWNGVNLIHCKDWEERIGTAGQFIYDLNCIRDSRKRNFDIILQLGYTSSSIWARLLPKKAKIITNMDGLECKRSKFSPLVQKFLKKAESWAVNSSDKLVADSKGIKSYLEDKYNVNAQYIAYGAPIAPSRDIKLLEKFNLISKEYHLLVARMEPENNIETILDGYVLSETDYPFIVVGKCENEFSKYLINKFKSQSNIKFIGGIYDLDTLDCIRQNCNLYFHGHSVGGTNPSLIEAMGCRAIIIAHDNQFNKSVLEDDGIYFSNPSDIASLLNNKMDIETIEKIKVNNLSKVKNEYNWDVINSQYEELMIHVLKS